MSVLYFQRTPTLAVSQVRERILCLLLSKFNQKFHFKFLLVPYTYTTFFLKNFTVASSAIFWFSLLVSYRELLKISFFSFFFVHRSTGAECYSYYDSTKSKIFVLIKYPLDKLMKFADLVNFKMLLDGTECERMCKAGDVENHIAPFQIGHDPSISIYKPYEYIYCRYVSLSFI